MTWNVLGIVGSLRAASYNRALMRAAVELAPADMKITVFDGIGDLPLFNGDVEAAGDPPPVQRFKQAIAAADALLIATPEYNYGVPGLLKNAIDWGSRPPGKSAFRGKPAAIVGASMGTGGTTRAQHSLRQSFVAVEIYAMVQPEFLLARAHDRIDVDGRLHDEKTRNALGAVLTAFSVWIARCRR